MLLVAGILAALVERSTSGAGQVVDAAMVDGVSMLMAPFFGAFAMEVFSTERGTNLLDSGAPFYDCYECADGEWVAVGAIEPQFFAALIAGLDLPDASLAAPERPRRLARAAAAIAGDPGPPHPARVGRALRRHRCVRRPGPAPAREPTHPQIAGRSTVVEVDGVPQHRPAPGSAERARRPPGRTSRGRRRRRRRCLSDLGVATEVDRSGRACGDRSPGSPRST